MWLLLYYLIIVQAQLQVVNPPQAVSHFPATKDLPKGFVPSATATFGAPIYGEQILGTVVWFPPDDDHHCTQKSYNNVSHHEHSKQFKNIFLVVRGDCSFEEKVYLAELSGADAVIIIDSADSMWSREDLDTIILASATNDDEKVTIPSVLVTHNDGKVLLAHARVAGTSHDKENLVVSLHWNLPKATTTNVDLWFYPAERNLSHMASHNMFTWIMALGDRVVVRPHISIQAMHGENQSLIDEFCYNANPNYCIPHATTSSIPGPDIISESIRQLCLLSTIDDEYSRGDAWMNYYEDFVVNCAYKMSATCSMGVMESKGIAVDKVLSCINDPLQVEDCLNQASDNKGWKPDAIRINGAKYIGALLPYPLKHAICMSLEKKPSSCSNIRVSAHSARSNIMMNILMCLAPLAVVGLLARKAQVIYAVQSIYSRFMEWFRWGESYSEDTSRLIKVS